MLQEGKMVAGHVAPEDAILDDFIAQASVAAA